MILSVINEEIVGYIIHYSNFHSEHLKSYNKLKSHTIKNTKSIHNKNTTTNLNLTQQTKYIKHKIDSQNKNILIK